MSTVTLIDGTEVDANSEPWRHECEARMIAMRPTLDERRAYLQSIQDKRGKAEADRLRETMKQLWEQRQKGNKQ